MIEITPEIAYNIRNLRLLSGLTQKDLAERTGVPFLILSRIETMRRKKVTTELLRNIEKVLGVHEGYLTENHGTNHRVRYINNYCRICGVKLFEDSLFCHKCGTKVLP